MNAADVRHSLHLRGDREHHGAVTQPSPDYDEAYENYEAWRDLQDVLEERDAEWWAEQNIDDDA